MTDPTLLFLHIPKAAGTTLQRVLERHVPARRQYRLGAEAQASIEAFNAWPDSRRARVRLISGHFAFGVHEQVPGPWSYLTMLRDPLERTASFYWFVRDDPGHYLSRAMTTEQRESLEVFARTTDAVTMDNGQTRLLSGDWGRTPFGQCGTDMLEQAKANLDRVDAVGLSEHFDLSLLLFARRFGWSRLGYRRANRTASRPRDLDPAAQPARDRLNALDLELYAYARERFWQDVDAAGLELRLEAEDFQVRHPPPSRLQDLAWRLRARTPREWLNRLCG